MAVEAVRVLTSFAMAEEAHGARRLKIERSVTCCVTWAQAIRESSKNKTRSRMVTMASDNESG